MGRNSRDLPRWTDPFPEIEAECLDDAGQLDPERLTSSRP